MTTKVGPWRPWLESCLTALDPPWWMPPFKGPYGRCCYCNYNTVVHPDHPFGPYFYCVHCLAGCPIEGGAFRCEYELSLLRGLYELRMGWSAPRRQARPGAAGSRNLFQRVKQAVSVEDLAGRFTALQSAGPAKLKGRCPLHLERTPSFYVYQDSQRWQCFGACATGGDVIELARRLMDLGKLRTVKP